MTAFNPGEPAAAEPTAFSRLPRRTPQHFRQGPTLTRRSLFKLGAGSAITAAGAYGLERGALGTRIRHAAVPVPTLNVVTKTLVATDGWVSGPDTAKVAGAIWPDNFAPANRNYYIFGFAEAGQFETPDPDSWGSIWTGELKPGFTPSFDVNGGPTQSGLPPALLDPKGNPIYDKPGLIALKNQANFSAPILYFHEGDDIRITLWNAGLQNRPDIVDTHTIHWHGFPNQIPYFDGVPAGSLSVPMGRNLVYRYLPYRGMAGAYMYHCHVGDVEHVQMGLQGIVFIRPYQNYGYGAQPITRAGQIALGQAPTAPRLGYVYNEGNGTTAYDREFAFIIDEIDTRIHWDDAHLGDQDFTEYAPKFFTLNGRSYPDTILPHGPKALDQVAPRSYPTKPLWLDPATYGRDADRLGNNPWSSLMQAMEGETILLRFSNLGYQEHSMELQGLPFTVIGKDAKNLAAGRDSYQENPNPDYAANTNFTKRDGITYTSHRVDLGPGESRELIVTIPANAGGPLGSPTVFNFVDRNYSTNNNVVAGGPNVGGMRTELHVFKPNTLPKQDYPQQLFPEA